MSVSVEPSLSQTPIKYFYCKEKLDSKYLRASAVPQKILLRHYTKWYGNYFYTVFF